MKFRILLIMTLFCCKSFSQEKIELNNLFFENGIAYNKINNQIFTGIAQNKNKKGHVKFEEIYESGKLIKHILYYNIYPEQIISDETIYNPKTNKKERHLRFSPEGNKYWETKYDQNEKKSEFNYFFNGNHILHEKYNNGKKDGKWFCLNDDGTICEMEYSNGKKIKDCR